MITRRLTRAASAAIAALAVLVVTAPPAAAHTISGIASTNYESVLLGPTPSIPGISVRLRDLGRRVEVVNTTAVDLVISGYGLEPYLRVGPSGVYENTRSPTLYKNRVTTPGVAVVIPPQATSVASPDWRRLSGDHVVRWRDQRTRHEGGTPVAVRDDPHHVHILATWSILMEWGTTQVVANGLIRWVPPPSPVPWLILSALIGTAVVLASERSQPMKVLAFCIAVGVGIDVAHSLVAVVAAADSFPQAAVKFLLGGFVSVIVWAAGGTATVVLARGNPDGLFLAAFSALVLLVSGGLGDVAILARSQIPYAVSPVTGRLMVSLTIGLGAGVLMEAIRALRRQGRASARGG